MENQFRSIVFTFQLRSEITSLVHKARMYLGVYVERSNLTRVSRLLFCSCGSRDGSGRGHHALAMIRVQAQPPRKHRLLGIHYTCDRTTCTTCLTIHVPGWLTIGWLIHGDRSHEIRRATGLVREKKWKKYITYRSPGDHSEHALNMHSIRTHYGLNMDELWTH